MKTWLTILMLTISSLIRAEGKDLGVYKDSHYGSRTYQYKILAGKSKESLIANAAAFYVNSWRAMKDEFKRESRSDLPKEATEILRRPTQDIKVLQVQDDLAIIEHSVTLNAFDDIKRGQSIWVFRSGTWRPFEWPTRSWQIEFKDLNGDEKSDIIARGGCCGWSEIRVYINASGNLRQTQVLQFIGNPVLEVAAPCLGSQIRHDSQDADKYGSETIPLQFDCKTLKFIKP